MKAILAIAATVGALALTTHTAAAQSGQCDAYARQYANQQTNAGGQAVAAGIFGGLFGAGIAAATGNNPGLGAGIGASLGVAGAVASNSPAWQQYYYAAYNNCVNAQPVYAQPTYPVQRPTPVGNPPWAGGYQPWTAEWYGYCQSAWRSFDPNTGWYLGTDGAYHWCRTRG